MTDVHVCPHGTCARQAGSQAAGIVQRLDDLMRRCREDRHQVTYRDLIEVRSPPPSAGPAGNEAVHHVPV